MEQGIQALSRTIQEVVSEWKDRYRAYLSAPAELKQLIGRIVKVSGLNFYAPRQFADGKWYFTKTVHGYYGAIGYCAGHHLQVPVPFGEKYHFGGHTTYVEASKCYKEFLLDNCTGENRKLADHMVMVGEFFSSH